jgi:hypothetical protein
MFLQEKEDVVDMDEVSKDTTETDIDEADAEPDSELDDDDEIEEVEDTSTDE